MIYHIIFHLCSVRGVIMERWNGIRGNELSRLITNARFPRKPNQARKIPRLVSPVNKGDNYGLRMRTYFRVIALYLCSELCSRCNLHSLKAKLHAHDTEDLGRAKI